jgi:hypothetical protein
MSLKKTVEMENPHATFVNKADGWTWKVLKVYAMAKTDKGNEYARWLLAVRSPATFGGYDIGDTYIKDVLGYATHLESATDEFKAYFEELRA